MLPVIDISPLLAEQPQATAVPDQIRAVCREHGFFYIVGHGVSNELLERLDHLSRQFFALPLEEKMAIRMELGGRAWRGFFPVGQELTSGKPDQKEGLYFGAELPAGHPEPMHGPNLFPASLPEFRTTVLEYLAELTRVGHALMRGMALSLGLPAQWFHDRYTADPLILFRIFHYPPQDHDDEVWGVGEHTDYGVLTILLQDDAGGLQVKSPSGWIDAPPIPGSFVCNLGDMLDRMTGGFYRSTPHRVRNVSGRSRLSFPFFFDPNFSARVGPIDPSAVVEEHERWDGASLHDFTGTYGDYVLGKVSKVFPQLIRDVS